MRRFVFCLLVFLLLPLSAVPQHRGGRVPPGLVEGEQQIEKGSQSVEKPMELRNKKFDVAQVKQEADELRKLADVLPDQIQQVSNNQLPKDLSDNLKRIERLAKHLRSEVVP
jgi:hypothetical protein